MGCYEQPAITAITPVMAAPITLSGDNPISLSPKKKGDFLPKFFWKPFNASHQGASVCSTFDPEMQVTTTKRTRALGEVN